MTTTAHRSKALLAAWALVAVAGCAQPPGEPPEGPEEEAARAAVAVALDPEHRLGLRGVDLRTRRNPKGEGIFVYVPRTDFSGATRNHLWLVLDRRAYALNDASKTATPSLPLSREIDDWTWRRTGLDKYQAADAIRLVWDDASREPGS